MTTVFEGGNIWLGVQAHATSPDETTNVTMDLSGDFSALTHVFIGVTMFNSGGTRIVDSTGIFTVTVKTVQSLEEEVPPSNVIDATAPTTVSIAGNITHIKVAPASLTDTDTYVVTATANRN